MKTKCTQDSCSNAALLWITELASFLQAMRSMPIQLIYEVVSGICSKWTPLPSPPCTFLCQCRLLPLIDPTRKRDCPTLCVVPDVEVCRPQQALSCLMISQYRVTCIYLNYSLAKRRRGEGNAQMREGHEMQTILDSLSKMDGMQTRAVCRQNARCVCTTL